MSQLSVGGVGGFNGLVLAFLRTPRGAIALSVVIVLAFLFVNLGLWQLRRHDERAIENQVMSARLGADATQMSDLLSAAGSDYSSLEYRRAEVDGIYHPELELLIRNMTSQGEAGFHVITPLETSDGVYVLVNRGWVPLEMDSPPVAADPPGGQVNIEGLIRLTQLRPSVGPVEPDGVLTVASRVDLDRLSQQIPGEVAPVWIQAVGEEGDLPIPVPEPDFEDAGPHLMYAFQWFAFALIGVVGFWFLVRNRVSAGPRSRVTPSG